MMVVLVPRQGWKTRNSWTFFFAFSHISLLRRSFFSPSILHFVSSDCGSRKTCAPPHAG